LKLKKKDQKTNLFYFSFTNHHKLLPQSLDSPNLKNSKPKVPKKLTQRFERLNLGKNRSLKPEK